MLNVVPLKEKRPAIKGWQERARPLAEWLADPEWAAWDRWGAPAGALNKFWVLDVDPRHGGLESLRALEEKYGPLGVVYTVRTPSGGLHFYFLWTRICADLRNTVGTLGPGLDIRVEGGQVAVPPTPGYVVEEELPLTEAPAWLLALLLPPVAKRTPVGEGGDPLNIIYDTNPMEPVEAPIRRPREHFARALQAAIEEIRAAPDGTKDHTMNRNAYGIGRLVEACGFSMEKVAEQLINECIALGYSPDKVLACIPRALADGAKHPRAVAASPAPAVPPLVEDTGTPTPGLAGSPEALRPCPPKPSGARPADPTSAAGRRWDAMDNEYRAWQRDLRQVLSARLVVIEYEQPRVLHERVGLRRVSILGTGDKQAGHIIAIGRRAGFLVSAGQASALAEEFLKQDADLVTTEHPTLWDTGTGLYRWESPKVEAGLTPTWDTFLARLSDPDAFLAFVWSIFAPEHKGRQALWLYGDGNDGKSIAINALMAGAGCPFAALNDGDLTSGNQFVFSSVWDKPVVLVGDSKNVNILMSGMLHRLTGKDSVSVEYKHGARFNAQFGGVVIITSNNLPQIEGSEANLSRLLPVRITRGEWVPDLYRQLRSEVPALLARCREVYARLCPRAFDIALNAASLELLGGAAAHDDEKHTATLALLGLRIEGTDFVARSEIVKRIIAHARMEPAARGSFYKWLARQPGVKEITVKGARGFRGLLP